MSLKTGDVNASLIEVRAKREPVGSRLGWLVAEKPGQGVEAFTLKNGIKLNAGTGRRRNDRAFKIELGVRRLEPARHGPGGLLREDFNDPLRRKRQRQRSIAVLALQLDMQGGLWPAGGGAVDNRNVGCA